MTIDDAQSDLRRAYVGGGPGVFVSGLVWLAAAMVERKAGIGPAFTTLFFGGMLIFPLGALACRLVFKRAKEAADNRLAAIALESTVAMIGGLLAAWLFLPLEPAHVFPIAAIAVGTHYAVFRTLYGDALFWVLGGLITAAGLLGLFAGGAIPGGTILVVGAIELLFAVLLTMRALRAEQAAG
ncbi:DUF7010 family protein [Sphingosinicella sp. LY1275]|uniref:DUF7010 family protein n=1 Tax=Sphingosinicella sp. LY1275 TaxID=3095379 RepID=UPI002ADEF908|nr:hypothetical protein [Sphingosinicella sp. LY1275]MEA1014449.1 hypothetical protein [Sphingosinicella sp. LY1275]